MISRLKDREQDDNKPESPTPKEREDTDQKQKTEETQDKRGIEDENLPSFSDDLFKNLLRDLAQGHESLNNVTPADVYFGRDKVILREREKIKKLTIRQRRLQHQNQAA